MAAVAQAFVVNVQLFLTCLPEVRDGESEAIHRARLASRRLRPILSVLRSLRVMDRDAVLTSAMAAAGKALGAARDLDVAIDLLNDIERRVPSTASATAALRAVVVEEQSRQRRRLIKRLESVDVERLLREAIATGNRFGQDWSRHRRDAERALIGRIPGHVEKMADEVAEATGVYFPNRAHRVRVAAKKLRYVLELLGDPPLARGVLVMLKRVQKTLGEIHDREMLARRLEDAESMKDVPGAQDLRRFLDADCQRRFERYRDARADLLTASRELSLWARGRQQSGVATRMLKVGTVAVPSAAILFWAVVKQRASLRASADELAANRSASHARRLGIVQVHTAGSIADTLVQPGEPSLIDH